MLISLPSGRIQPSGYTSQSRLASGVALLWACALRGPEAACASQCTPPRLSQPVHHAPHVHPYKAITPVTIHPRGYTNIVYVLERFMV